jgi:hypothetical protein
MILNVAETIRKIMGWCPQKDYVLKHVENENYKLGSAALYKMDTHLDEEKNIILDYQYMDIVHIAVTLFVAIVAVFALFMVGFVLPIYRIFALLLFASAILIASLILLYQARSIVEFTSHAIIIQRPLFKSIVIGKDRILKTEIVKNHNHTIRWVILPAAIILLIVSGMDLIDVVSQHMAQSFPFSVIIPIVFSKATIMLLFLVLFYKSKIRSYSPNTLKITTKTKKNIILYLYVDNPEELMSRLGVTL